MAATDNLISLHNGEEQLRASSLAVIQADADLSEHWYLVAEATTAIYAFSHDHVHVSEDELVLQLLGIRLFNAAGASIKLGLSGYYQKAFHQIRDVIETSFLVDYLKTHPEEIDEWRRADRKKRMSDFNARRIREALDRRDGYTSGERKKIYDTISEYATHASFPGVTLTAMGPTNMAPVVAGRDGDPPELRGLDPLAKPRRERHEASDYPEALHGGLSEMVVEVSRGRVQVLGGIARHAAERCAPPARGRRGAPKLFNDFDKTAFWLTSGARPLLSEVFSLSRSCVGSLAQQVYDLPRLCRCVGWRAVCGPRRFKLTAQIPLAAYGAGVSLRWPDCARPGAEEAQQTGEFALGQLARRAIIVWATPVVP